MLSFFPMMLELIRSMLLTRMIHLKRNLIVNVF